MVKTLLIAVAVIHGLIHLLGFVKAFNLAPVEQLTADISKPAGLFWLMAAVLFLTTAVLYFVRNDAWWIIGGVAVIISQILIVLSWSDARYGTIANVILAVFIIMAYAGQLPASSTN